MTNNKGGGLAKRYVPQEEGNFFFTSQDFLPNLTAELSMNSITTTCKQTLTLYQDI